jgi:uncharacterized protein (TIGR03437 family)
MFKGTLCGYPGLRQPRGRALGETCRFDFEAVRPVVDKKQVRIPLLALVLIAAVQVVSAQPLWMSSAGRPVQDQEGNVYFVGSVDSNVVPVTAGAFQTKFNGGTCGTQPLTHQPVACYHGFAVKISADGKTVLYATYLEGSANDAVSPVGVDASGDLFVLAGTTSTDFPQTGTMNGLPPISAAHRYYILELSAGGSHVLFSNSFGFPGNQEASSLNATALAPNGDILFAGTTDATAFPTTPGAYLAARPNVSLNGFVFEWDPQTNQITHSTLIGGSNQDLLTQLATDAEGNVYVAGYTISTDFPVTQGAFYSPGTTVLTSPAVNDFVAKLDPTLSTLDFSALFGGSYHPLPGGIAVDSAGNVYVDGSGSENMPVTPGAFETSYSGGFLVKLSGSNGSRIYFTYLGDGVDGTPGPIAPAGDGSVWVSGYTYGMVVTPVGAMQTPSFDEASYLEHISQDGSKQLYATYFVYYPGMPGAFFAMVAPGVLLESSSTTFFQTQNFNALAPPLQGPLITSVVNAASFGQPDYVAPGEIVSITGLSIGPAQPVSYSVVSGVVSSNLNGLQVLIDGLAAPILYASANQINAIMPWGVTLPTSALIKALPISLEVRNPALSAALTTTVTPVTSQPGIFEAGGAGLILNQDSTPNGPTNPAQQGSIISLFVTGLGSLSETPQDGSFATVGASPTLPIQVFLGSGPTTSYVALDPSAIKYAGDAPGEIEGLQQINVQLPAGVVFNSLYVTAGPGVSNAVRFFEQ